MLRALSHTVRPHRLPVALLLAIFVVGVPTWGTSALAASGAHAAAKANTKKRRPRSILHSSLLWATVDACNPPDHRNTIGIRGSMPGDGKASEQMYMRFRVQYRDPSTGRFRFVSAADSDYILVGRANVRSRQAGRNFQFQLSLQPPPYRPTYVLRGYVDFQWRKGRRVVRATAMITTAPHRTGAAGDPPGYTASTCTLS